MARERYLLHAGEETINRQGAEIKAATPRDKWQNFWYYHKWHVLIGIVVVLLAAFFIRDALSVVHPDYEIALVTQNTYSEDAINELEAQMAQSGVDLNSDGKVVVQVDPYVISSDAAGGMNAQMAGVVKLDADLAAGTSMIFMTDDASFQDQQTKSQIFAYLDGSMPAENATDYSRMRVALKDCKKLASLGEDTTPGGGKDILNTLSMSMRVFQGTQLEKDKGKSAYFDASKKLFDQIIAGQ